MTSDYTITLTLTEILAFWGAVAGSLGLFIHYLTFKRDRANIRLLIKTGYNVINSPQHDPKKVYTVITVSNKGRRVVTINSVGFVYLKKKGGAILSDSFQSGRIELGEGKSHDYLIEENLVDPREISYYAAYDAVGNTYKKYEAPFFKRIFYWFLYVTRLGYKRPNKGISGKFKFNK